MKIVFATSNQGKVTECQALLAGESIEIIPQTILGIPDVPETGLTFVENALIKARHASKISGLPAIADDSGLAVVALQGEPGIYSARYAGDAATAADNRQKLLNAMAALPSVARECAYHCVMVYLSHPEDPTPIICQGRWFGRLLEAPQGTGGFGYDPIFLVPEKNCSAAELSLSVKNAMSHRGQALRQLIEALK